MLDLPFMNSGLDQLKQEIVQLKRGKRQGHYRPHKLVMLLAVIDLAERGLLEENKIFLSDVLLLTFENIFLLVKKKDDMCQPGPPFFHLRSSGFWFHKVRPGCEGGYSTLTTTGGGLHIIDRYIEYAYLRDDVYTLVQDPTSRRELRLLMSRLLNATEDNDG
jgi:predicted restriction endonuclease